MRRKIVLSLCLCLLLLSVHPVKTSCAPSAENDVTVSLPDSVKAGEMAVLTLDPAHDLPAGSFWRVDVTWTERPEGREPEVLTGMPKTDIRFFVPGRYRGSVETGIVCKGSCACVTYSKLSTHTFDIEVME